jgi:FMN phosphatase YigB (HAD superfamily)
MTDRFRAVLFDWRDTLFHDESDAEWIRTSAASIGRSPSTGDADALAKMLGAAADHPEVLAARSTADCSAELHRAAVLLELRLAGFDDELALAICDHDGDVAATMPYPDTPGVLRDLKALGMRISVISDIHYDLRRHFVHYGLDHLIDRYTLSFEHGVQKPDPRLFQSAVSALGQAPQFTLMVGDNPHRDGGAAAIGITTLILPPGVNFEPRGLGVVLRLVQAA